MKRRFTYAILLAGFLALAVGGLAIGRAAEKTTVKAGLDAGPSGDSISGKVKSNEKDCVKGRKVKVTYQDAPAPKETIGTDKADKKGNYSVSLGPGQFAPPGTYTATAKKVTVEGIKCAAGKGTYEHFGGGGDGGPVGDPNAPDV